MQIFLTPTDKDRPQSAEEVLHNWHSGKRFKMYHSTKTTRKDLLPVLQAMRVQRIVFVWQTEDKRVHSTPVEIGKA